MPEIFTYTFMQRAFLVGNVIAIVSPLIGVFLTLRRLTLIGNTISHVALTGIILGILCGVYPIYMGIIISIIAALGIEKLRNSYQDYAELSLSIILASGLGLATILISLSNNSIGIMGYLFGSITLINSQDIYVVIPLGLIIIGVLFTFYYGFFYISFSEDDARLAGVPTGFLNILFMVIISIAISISMRIIGGFLIASLISIPVATAIQIARSFKETILYSIFISLFSVNIGLLISFYYDLAPGGTIILTNIFCLLLTLFYNRLKRNMEWSYG